MGEFGRFLGVSSGKLGKEGKIVGLGFRGDSEGMATAGLLAVG